MAFIFSKIFGLLAAPSNLFVFIGLIGIALLPTRFAAAGRRLIVAGLLLIAAIGFLPVGEMLAQPLEGRFPAWTPAQGPPSGMIVLGGVINPSLSVARGQVALNDAAERLTSAVALAFEYPDARIVFSSGNAELIGGRPEGDFAMGFLTSLGVAPNRVAVETQSRNTEENALYVKRLIAPKPGERWLLITSAMHMPRAMGTFRQAGFPVSAYPVDYQTTGKERLLSLHGSALAGIRITDLAVHEWIGLLYYRLRGWTRDLFPGPSRN
jgi:uncharacterized SAM-binding protein YcdF (DUF218 family)